MSSGLLTRKQSWRRQSRVVKRQEHDFLYNEGVGECGEFPTRSASEPKVNGLLNIARLGRLWATTGNLTDGIALIPKKVLEKKKVKFQPAVRVVLIPSRAEYATADISIELWWDDSDYTAFKTAAVSELKSLMRLRNICNSKEAIRILYQPDEEDLMESRSLELSRTGDPSSPLSSPPMIEDVYIKLSQAEASCCYSASELELTKLPFLAARTDVDMTALNFDKISSKGDTILTEMKKVHPLAHMCA